MKEFRACFEGLDDPLGGNAVQHEMHELLLIALLTFYAAAKVVYMEEMAGAKEGFLKSFLTLPDGGWLHVSPELVEG